MLINLKYYLIFVIVIFLTLGIGILIGLNMNSGEFLESQKTSLVSEIEQEFITLRNQNNYLLSRLNETDCEKNMYYDLSNKLFESYTYKKLTDKNICIIEMDSDWVYTDISELVEKAGAKVTTVITINSYDFDQADIQEFTNSDLGINNIFDKLVLDLCLQLDSQLLNKLDSMNIIDISNIPFYKSEYIIFASGDNAKDQKTIRFIDGMLKAIKNFQVKAVAIEKTDIKNTTMNLFKKQRISTIDNVDEITGNISLIEILAGAKGNFGCKDYADAMMPETLIDLKKLEEEQEN
ncbi:MAG: copper transporter [Clostridia bacterium]|nr:copper transporter [Clostridia bacterium]